MIFTIPLWHKWHSWHTSQENEANNAKSVKNANIRGNKHIDSVRIPVQSQDYAGILAIGEDWTFWRK